MTSTLIDSNVLIDVVKDLDPWRVWAAARLSEAADRGRIIVNQIVVAETAIRFRDYGAAETLNLPQLTRESLPWDAAFEAGRAHRAYRRRGGARERTLPDFLIGAHALVRGYRLLTRDARRYRAYFPTLDIIAPDTHP
jgi:predicted nucleic acid-binding protein